MYTSNLTATVHFQKSILTKLHYQQLFGKSGGFEKYSVILLIT